MATLVTGGSYTAGNQTFILNKTVPVDETLYNYLRGLKNFDTKEMSEDAGPISIGELDKQLPDLNDPNLGVITVKDLGTAIIKTKSMKSNKGV